MSARGASARYRRRAGSVMSSGPQPAFSRVNNSNDAPDRTRLASESAEPILDPRLGDMENDHSATKQRSLLAITGSLLAEISLTKLLFAWAISILLPAVLLGLAPLALTAWIGKASNRLAEATGSAPRSSSLAVLAVAMARLAPAVSAWPRRISGR